MITPPRLVSAILILFGLAMAGCTSDVFGSGGSASITCDSDFSSLLPPDWKIIGHTALEPDNQSQLVCVVFFRFDVPKGGWPKVPVGGVVVRQDRNRPHDLHTYPLSLPGGTYLGEHNVSAREAAVLSGITVTEAITQVIVEDKTAEGIIVEASIFGWREAGKSEGSGYNLLGTFLGDGGVTVEPDKVTVLVRHAETRSQLADRRIYRPHDQSYFQKDGFKLVPPFTVGWVTLSMPEDPATSEYPEKVVLAFYENLTDTTKLGKIMAPEVLNQFKRRDQVFGCLNGAQPANVVITDVQYIQASPVPSHTENSNVVITETITVTGKCLTIVNDKIFGTEVTKLVWQVKWEKDDPERNELDRWVLLKPSIKP